MQIKVTRHWTTTRAAMIVVLSVCARLYAEQPDALADDAYDKASKLFAVTALVLAALFVLVVVMILARRASRRYTALTGQKSKCAEFTDPWAEAGKRFQTPEDDQQDT